MAKMIPVVDQARRQMVDMAQALLDTSCQLTAMREEMERWRVLALSCRAGLRLSEECVRLERRHQRREKIASLPRRLQTGTATSRRRLQGKR